MPALTASTVQNPETTDINSSQAVCSVVQVATGMKWVSMKQKHFLVLCVAQSVFEGLQATTYLSKQ